MGEHVKSLTEQMAEYAVAPAESGEITGDDYSGDGRAHKQHQVAVSLYLSDGTVKGAIYSHFKGAPERNRWRGSTEIRFVFMGVVGREDEEWEATITGENLDQIHGELTEARRMSIRPTKEPKGDRWVKTVAVRRFEAEALP